MILKKLNVAYKNAAYCKYDYSTFDKDNFLADVSKINWARNDNESDHDVNVKCFSFHDKVSESVRDHAPLVKLSRKKFIAFKTLDTNQNRAYDG